jgi:hypothetical protein
MIIGKYDKNGKLLKIINNQLDFYIVYYDEYLKYGVDIHSDGFYYIKFEEVKIVNKIEVGTQKVEKKSYLHAFDVCDIRYQIKDIKRAMLIYDRSKKQIEDILTYKVSNDKMQLYRKISRELRFVQKASLIDLRNFNNHFREIMRNVKPTTENYYIRKNYLNKCRKYKRMIKEDENLL